MAEESIPVSDAPDNQTALEGLTKFLEGRVSSHDYEEKYRRMHHQAGDALEALAEGLSTPSVGEDGGIYTSISLGHWEEVAKTALRHLEESDEWKINVEYLLKKIREVKDAREADHVLYLVMGALTEDRWEALAQYAIGRLSGEKECEWDKEPEGGKRPDTLAIASLAPGLHSKDSRSPVAMT